MCTRSTVDTITRVIVSMVLLSYTGSSLAGPDLFFLTRAEGALKMGLEN